MNIHSENNIPYPAWGDINTSGLALRVGGSAPGFDQVAGSGLYVYTFDGAATTEQIYGAVEIQHEYQIGTTLFPHIHWMAMTGATGAVKWNLEYNIQTVGAAFVGSTTISAIGQANGMTFAHMLALFGGVSGASISINSIMNFRIYRDPTDSEDTFPNDAGLLQFGIHFLKDGIGSASQSAK